MRALGFSLVIVAATGCSLLGLDDVQAPPCTPEGCQALNEREGIPADACRLYQCRSNGECRFLPRDIDGDDFPPPRCADALPECDGALSCTDCDDANPAVNGAAETCDGLDNDCNGLIDDAVVSGGTGQSPVVLLEDLRDIGPSQADDFVHYAATLDGMAVAVTHATPSGAGFDRIGSLAESRAADTTLEFETGESLGRCPERQAEAVAPADAPVVGATPPMTCAAHEECADGLACNGNELCDPPSAFADAFGCRPADAVCASGFECDEAVGACVRVAAPVDCAFGDLATAELEDAGWFVASIDTEGCAAGKVRVGALEVEAPPHRVTIAGEIARSTGYFAIDPTPGEEKCTGASRPAGEPLGAASIEVAALPAAPERGASRLRPQALVAWIAAPQCRTAPGVDPCTDNPPVASVEILGLFEESVRLGASGDPTRVVNATSDGRGQALDVPTSGADRPAIVAVDSSGWSGYLVAYPRAGGGLVLYAVGAMDAPGEVMRSNPYDTILPEVPASRTTEPISTIGAAVELPGGAGSAVSTDHVRMAVGEAADGRMIVGIAWAEMDEVWFGTIELSTEGGSADLAASSFDPVQLASVRGVSSVAMIYADRGIYAEHATESLKGGWFVVWSEQFLGVMGHRVAAQTGESVGEPFVVGSRLTFSAPTVALLPTDLDGDVLAPRVLVHDEADEQLLAFPAVCGSPAP